ncbi:MAG TPA: hypothetical protein PKJ42_08705 [Candidatus Goldiibacteriota bacterium]|nr:hypothetical protein [Candidatus Goldiibacteriota bacterium]
MISFFDSSLHSPFSSISSGIMRSELTGSVSSANSALCALISSISSGWQ